ncbi:hypothetical protein JW835_16770 [bacterium]|nr:hypothetical protein [bacterium]
MKIKNWKREDGFWSAVFLLLMVGLGTMALSSYLIMQKEAENTVNNAIALQADYSATGAAYYALAAFRQGIMNDGDVQTVDIAGISCDIYLNELTVDDETNFYINVNGFTDEGVGRSVEIKLSALFDFAGCAINCEKDVGDKVKAKAEGGSVHIPSLIVENTPLPPIDTASLIAHANVYVTSKSDLVDGFPANLTAVCPDDPFYQADCMTPNIIYVAPGVGLDLKGGGGWRTISGIFITDGDVITNGGHTEIDGVVFVTNPDATVEMKGNHGGRAHVVGGIVSYGVVDGKNPWVEHKREYMDFFAQYVGGGRDDAKILSWKYIDEFNGI